MTTTVSLDVLERTVGPQDGGFTIALAGNPNAGKTTIFNLFTGLRAKTANFPGTTIERRVGTMTLPQGTVELIDLPGLYSLAGATSEERIARDVILGHFPGVPRPAAVIVVLDATNLERNLYLASQVLELGVPTIVGLNMMDLASHAGTRIDSNKLSLELGCPVVPLSARAGGGIDDLKREVERLVTGHLAAPEVPPALKQACNCGGCPFKARFDWAEEVGGKCITAPGHATGRKTAAIDRVLTHPVVGVAAFLSVMFAVFAMIFWLASYPMDMIEGFFGWAGGWAAQLMPEGDLRSLVVDGIIGGVGGVLVFLPQICILFFFLSLLEDTGYLARAAFVMDRLMRRVGLPGKAFVPMLSAHACAIPAIMAARVIDDKRDRLVTTLVLPLFTCSARIPVYAMVTALLFREQPLLAALMFTGAYCLGIVAALVMAFAFKRTILPGESRPLVLELPSYKLPVLRNALLHTLDRGLIFVKKAGTTILLISVVLWAASTYPKSEPPAQAQQLREQAQLVLDSPGANASAQAEELLTEADRLEEQHALANSAAGKLGHLIEPIIRPLGYDWQIGVGVISSFAAREVIVSTLAIVYGVGADAAEEDAQPLYDTMRAAQRSDGTPVFTTATCVSLLVFYVLAMQCLPTQVVTRRETGSWKWAFLQLGYMSVLAYGLALVAYQSLTALGY